MLSKNPLVSVIVPSFQQASYLERSVRSILEQTYPHIECFVEDGGSTDGSIEILRKLKKEFPKRLQWVSERDGGQADALNKGFRKTNGEIVAYLNSDDEYEKGAVELIIKKFSTNPNTIWITGDCKIINENGVEIQTWIRLYKKFLRSLLTRSELLVVNPIAQPATFWRKSVEKAVGPFRKDLRYCMDYDYWLRLWKAFGHPIIVTETLAKFRIHTQSKGGSQFERQFAEEILVAREHESNLILQALHKIHVMVVLACYKRLKKTT